MAVYTQPEYYEVAFSFIDVNHEIALFEEIIKKYSKIPVARVLDIGCGPSLQLRELAKRGYDAIGLDNQSEMLDYLQKKAHTEGVHIETVKADMCNFTVKKVDFAFIMMGTIGLIQSNADFLLHLDSVAKSLKKGGLYVMENVKQDWTSESFFGPQTWVIKRDHISVKTTYNPQVKDTLTQMLTETLRLDVNDDGATHVFEEKRDVKMIFPQEFLVLLELNGKFEFVGWFERDTTKELKKANNYNITILRRK